MSFVLLHRTPRRKTRAPLDNQEELTLPGDFSAERKDGLGSNIRSPIPRPEGGNARATNRRRNPAPFPWEKRIPVNTRDLHRELRKYTDPAEKRIARWLYSTWNAQADAIKFQEIENAIRDGEVSRQWLERWRADYTRFVNETLDPEWRLGMSEGADYMSARLAESMGIAWNFPETTARIEKIIDERGAALVAGLTSEQQLAVRNIIRRTIADEGASVDELAKRLRPMIGLTDREALAVDRRRLAMSELVTKKQISKEAADRRVQRYSDFLLRRRASRIARTETAFAFNFGAFEGVREAVAEGFIPGGVVKKFSTSDDERVCPFCGPLDGQVVGLEETFPGQTSQVPNTYVPPVHPQCRCTIIYEINEDKRSPRVSPPLPRGMNPVTPENADEFRKEYLRQLVREGRHTEVSLTIRGSLSDAPRQIYLAIEEAAKATTDILGGRSTRVFVQQDNSGRILGAVAYRVVDRDVWEVLNLGSLHKGSIVGGDLFRYVARDALAHDVGLTWDAPPGSKGFFGKLGFASPGEATSRYTVSKSELKAWAEKNGVSVPGVPVNRPTKKPKRARPGASPAPRNEGRVDVPPLESWKPVSTRDAAIGRLKSHFESVSITPTFRKEVGSDAKIVAILNALDAEIIRLKNLGAVPSGVRINSLELTTRGNRGRWNGLYSWSSGIRLGNTRAYYRRADMSINVSTVNQESRFPSLLTGSTDQKDFLKYLSDSSTAAVDYLPDPDQATRWSTSGGRAVNTLRHEIGHAVSVPQQRLEQEVSYGGPRPWAAFNQAYRRLVSTRKQTVDLASPAAKSISRYATSDPDELFAESYAMIYAEGFKPGSLDAELGIDGFEQLVRDVVETVQ